MAKGQPATRAAVTIRGVALLSAIAAGAIARLTADEVNDAMAAGHVAVNTNDVDQFGAAAVTLTEAGQAAITAEANKPASSKLAIDADVPMPAASPTKRGGAKRESAYPFDALEVGQSFHVPKTSDNPDPKARLSSTVSAARAGYMPGLTNEDGTPKMETVTKSVYATDAAGKFVKGADGKRIKTGEATETRQARGEPTRDFAIFEVDDKDPRGAGARVFRTK